MRRTVLKEVNRLSLGGNRVDGGEDREELDSGFSVILEE